MLSRWFSFAKKSASTVTGWEALVDYGRSTAAGIHVSPDNALRCSAVFAGVRLRCETIGSLPLHLYRRRKDGGKDRADNHSLHRLLHDRPNPWTSAAELAMQLEKDCILHGHGHAVAIRSGEKIVELIRLKPGTVTEEQDPDTLEPRYKVAVKGNIQQTYRWQDILHIPSLDGLSPVRQCAESIGLAIALERHAARLFGNGGRPSGVLKTKHRQVSDATLQRLKESWNSNHAGENSGHTAILEDGLEFEALTFNSVDLQFQEMRLFQIGEIARAIGVPPVLIFDYSRATWGNFEQAAQAFLTFCLLPRLKLWHGAISRLLSPAEQREYYPEFLIDGLVQADFAARFEGYHKAIMSRVLNPNEVRARENLPAYDGGDEFANPNIEPAAEASPRPQAKPRLAG